MGIWKIISLNCGEWYENIINHGSYTHHLTSCKIKAWKNKQTNKQTKQNQKQKKFTGCSNWERVPKESERVSQSQAIFTVEEDSIANKPSRKIATAYASKPDPRSDLIYLRFYVYSDNQDSKMVSDQMRDRIEDIVLKYAWRLPLWINRTVQVHLHTQIAP